ncbi:MAG TPA: Ig-like domain repeat protein [Candidatus Acidoferrum sp.]|nr:Ig-like domain repeat protein [Candidatus Acidoferrum sp.]
MTRQRLFEIRILTALVLSLAVLTVITTFAAPATAQDPVPLTNQPLVPDATAPGGPGFTLTVNGAGFVATSVVNWDGNPRTTTFVSKSRLTAAVLASDIATASTAAVTVVSPGPGGGVSNTLYFSIMVQESSLSFLPAVTYNSGGYIAQSIKIADLNGDGKPDVIVANWWDTNNIGAIGILLGNGDGTFQPVSTYETGGATNYSVVVADVNRDGKLDLVVSSCAATASTCGSGEGVVSVLLGNGDGTFRHATSFGSGALVGAQVDVADVNGDGNPDIIATNFQGEANGDGTAAVFLGNGDGTFRSPVLYDSGAPGANVVRVADVNGDGVPDLLVANGCFYYCAGGGTLTALSVLLGNGDGTFRPAVTYPTGGKESGWISVADLNGDGKLDVVLANTNIGIADGTVSVLLGVGDGTFEPPVTYDSGAYAAVEVAIADVNGDGVLDLVVADCACGPPPGIIGVLLGRGDGTFDPVVTFSSGAYNDTAIAVADLNGDGKPDLIAANQCDTGTGYGCPTGSVAVLLNNGGPGESTTTTLASSLNPSSYGQRVTFAASVSSTAGTPTGTVIFYDGVTSIGSATLAVGSAAVSVSSLAAASHSITAVYKGSATFSSTTSAPLSQTVKIATSTTALASSLSPAGTGQTITFTATVSSQFGGAAKGSVTFYSGSETLGTASLSGNHATLSTSFASSGTYSISAKYSGDNNNAGSTSSTLSQVIISSTTTTLVSSLNPSLVGQAVTFTATVSSAAGAPPNGELITFKNGSSILGTAALSGGIASLTTSSLPAGTDTITASYAGDANFSGSTSPGLRQVVNNTTKSATSTTLSSSLNPSIYGQSVTFKATVTTTGSVAPIGKVNFTWDGYSIGTATLNTSGVATLTKSNLNVYTYPLTATYSGDANNAGSTSAVVNQVVKETTSAATISSSANPSIPGQAVTFTATITSPTAVPTGPVTFMAGTTVLGTAQLSGGKATFTTSTLAAGSTTVKATYYGDSNIAESSAAVTQIVQQ